MSAASHLGGWSKCSDVIKAFPDGAKSLKDATLIITGPTSGIGVEVRSSMSVYISPGISMPNHL
jgi:hypothetical protein